MKRKLIINNILRRKTTQTARKGNVYHSCLNILPSTLLYHATLCFVFDKHEYWYYYSNHNATVCIRFYKLVINAKNDLIDTVNLRLLIKDTGGNIEGKEWGER